MRWYALAGGVVAGAVAFVLGFLLANYRSIFFAMLSLAFSMILYGLLIKMSVLGSSDGFNITYSTAAGIRLTPGSHLFALYAVSVAMVFAALLARTDSQLARAGWARDPRQRAAGRIHGRLGSQRRAPQLVAAAVLPASAAAGRAVDRHIDPEMAYWTTSGEFVFVAILSGTTNVAAPFLGSLIFEWIKSIAYQYTPYTWQLVLGVALLLVIMFLPAGLWSLFGRRGKGHE
jgi:branched-chain amino acid transport system permease protein